MKRISRKKSEAFIKGKYTLWHNDKFLLMGKYGKSHWYLRDIKELLEMFLSGLLGLLTLVAFPIIVLYTLFTFIPKIYRVDESIDRAEEEERNRMNEKAKEALKLHFDKIDW